MANICDDFDKAIDTEGLAKDVEEAAENGGRREVCLLYTSTAGSEFPMW